MGLVDHEAGRGDDALGAYAAAIDGTSRTGSHRHEALFRAARAALLATLDRDAALAREDLARALDAAGGLGPRPLALAVAAFREVARARWDDAGTAGLPALPEGATVDDDVVIARRIAGAALAGLAPAPVLVVSADCADVRLAAPIDLSRRAPLRRVLGALVDAHARDRGAYVPPEALQAAGWPGERMLADAGRQRVRVAIWTLRKLGLQDVVESEAGAYRLSPRVVVERARPRV
ncbi:MAG: hypothetical protein H6745_27955 [Deltaproteobacteria bacterium]|nr:hypothetical protein [Deltaproteobacteria bacterium]